MTSPTSRRDMLRLLSLCALTGGVVGAGWVHPATAQSDWLGKAKSLLGGIAGDKGGALGTAEIAAGLREALQVGSGRVIDRVGAVGGFFADNAIRIPLPGVLQDVRDVMAKVGMSGMADDLHERMNHAAEVASGKARPLFVDAIKAMTMKDAMEIYEGPKDAATRYFQRQMTPGLKTEMRPVVDGALAETGAVRSYDNMMGRYRDIPFVPDVKADLVNHTVDGGLKGVFHYLAKEEASIRSNPAARTTDLLRRVFG